MAMTYPRNTFNSDEGVHSRTGLMRFAGEITLLVGFGALVFIVLALLSYSPQDAAWSTSGVAADVLHNRAGRVGAWIADVAYALMGYSAWWCVAAALFVWMLALMSWMRGNVRERDGRRSGSWWTFWLGLALLLLTSCGLEWTCLHSLDGALPGSAGGVLGHVSGRLAVQWLGYTGSTLLELAALACALALVFRFSWGRVAERVGALVYDFVARLGHFGTRLRDFVMGVRAARARAQELDLERTDEREGTLSSLIPPAPLAPQGRAADIRFDAGRVEPAFDASVEEGAPAAEVQGSVTAGVGRRAAWSSAVRPERIQLPSFLQGVQAPQDEVQQLQEGGKTSGRLWRRGWLGAALAPVFARKATRPQAERIEPQMYGQQLGSGVCDWHTGAAPAVGTALQEPAVLSAAWAPTEQIEASGQACEDGILRTAEQVMPQPAQSQPSPLVQAARAALAARASRRMELHLQEEEADAQSAEERAWAAAAAAYAPDAEGRQEAAPLGRFSSVPGAADEAAGVQHFEEYSEEEEGEEAPLPALKTAFVVSSFNPVRGSAPDADEGLEGTEDWRFPSLSAMDVQEGEADDSSEFDDYADEDDSQQTLEALPPLQAAPPRAAAAPRPAPVVRAPELNVFSGPVPLPQLDLLDPAVNQGEAVTPETLEMTSRLIEKKLKDFGVNVEVVEASPGPVITRYEIEPAPGVKGSRIVNLAKDLARSLSLVSIRVVETIPGKNCMALELPNARRQTIRLTEVLDSDAYRSAKSLLTVGLGKDIIGRPVVADLAKMPHVLVAGTTGSGKSVGINAMILSLLYKADPKDVRLMLIDPKMLEMSVYEGIPHLLCPVVTDMRQAANGLNWCVEEMERRYRLMSRMGVRNLAGFNAKILEADARGETIPNPFSLTPEEPEPLDELPSIVVIVDELADLMMTAGKKIEELIARLAQKARAAGIHLVLATQRPSTDVLTGLIKANIPTRMSFKVASMTDSRIILDRPGAEALLGNGDMLYQPSGSIPQRVHGAFVSDDEVHRVASFLREHSEPNYIEGVLEGGTVDGENSTLDDDDFGDEQDSRYDLAVDVVLKTRRASISSVQRHLKVGYNRAARLLESMERAGVVSAMNERGQREVLVPKREED